MAKGVGLRSHTGHGSLLKLRQFFTFTYHEISREYPRPHGWLLPILLENRNLFAACQRAVAGELLTIRSALCYVVVTMRAATGS